MGLRELNIDLNKEHVALWKETKKFMNNVWRPAAITLDQLADPEEVIAKDSVLWETLAKTFDLGYHTMGFPEEFGGTNQDILSSALVAELMGWAASDLAVSFGVCSVPFTWAMLSQDPEVQELARIFTASKNADITGCWAITEPDHGSDWGLLEDPVGRSPACAPQVVAIEDGDSYVINGQKSNWVSNGTFAKYAALWLTLDPSKGMGACGVAVIPLDLPGITRGNPLHKMGQRALNQGEIFFDNVRIPKGMMIAADPTTYELVFNGQLTLANGGMGLTFAGTALAALEEALDYAKNRVQGGVPIINHQNIKLKLFDMFTAVEAARSLARRQAVYNKNLVDKMQPPALHYAMASKILSTETAFKVASEAVQIFGGYGLSKEFHIEKIFRDARTAMIEDGINESLALEGTNRLARGRGSWMVQDANAQAAPKAGDGDAQGLSWEDMEPIMRPKGVQMGMLEVDAEKCTQCGLCYENCPFRAWEKATKDKVPQMNDPHECFSCYNCMVACPVDAISIKAPYHVTEGFYKSEPGPLPAVMPLSPKNAENGSDEWNPTEKLLLERRSVRNLKPDPVPDALIRRVLEAGRFAPSAGNCQPWKFVVVTDKALIEEMNEACYGMINMTYTAYMNDAMVKGLVSIYEQDPNPGLFDPRLAVGGMGSVSKKNGPVFLDAPVVILVACDERSIGGPEINAGICGQNMNMAAMSLGLGCTWVGFSQFIEYVPDLKAKLGLEDPFKIATALVLGYPKFKQEGMVPREFRPVTWFREGADAPVEEDQNGPMS